MSGKKRSAETSIEKFATKVNNEPEEIPKTNPDHFAVKTCLSGRLQKTEDLDGRLTESRLKEPIEILVQHVSRLANRASLILNCLLIHCLSNDVPNDEFPDLLDQTTYRRCFFVGTRGGGEVEDERLEMIWREYFINFPTPERLIGDNEALCYEADRYMVNTKVYFVENLKKKINSWVRKWMAVHNIDDDYFKAIAYAIKGWNCQAQPPLIAVQFIQEQRALLENPECVNDAWIYQNFPIVVKYFWNMLRYMEQFEDSRKFNIAPICKIGCRFVTIDTETLYHLAKNTGLYSGTMKNFRSTRLQQFRRFFNLKGLTSKKNFSYMVQTDGVGLCVHFRKKFMKLGRRKRKTIKSKKKKRKKMPIVKRSIGADPGRVNLIQTFVEEEYGDRRSFRLRRNDFYKWSGIDQHITKTTGWMEENEEIRTDEEFFRQFSSKTTNFQTWQGFLQAYIAVYDTLWKVRSSKKWRQSQFRVFRLKRRIVDRFFQKMALPHKESVVAYGDARFSSTARGERSAPTVAMRRACTRHFRTVKINEYYTSQVCPKCEQLLGPIVEVREDGSEREVRGLRWCQSTMCSQSFLKSRDRIGAENIKRCYDAGEGNRPHSLSRGTWDNIEKPAALRIRFTQTEPWRKLSERFSVVW